METQSGPAQSGSPQSRSWYQDAIIYELHVRAFLDSSGDGHGDFPGLTQKLDYLRDLGVTAIWLLPFFPSPLRDDGYDISDYTAIHPRYGDLNAFRNLIRAAHERELRVIIELVLNHTSDSHPWFQRARRAPAGSSDRDFYVWSDSPERFRDARVIFQDFESSNWTFDEVARAYYWHRFYSHQPDLNFDNPSVRDAIFPVVDFWFDLGVDGMRLDAVPYLFEREGTNCENLPETHAFLRELRRHVDERYSDRMLLAEANQWPEDAAAYFGDGDECQMAFHFPLMPRLFMAIYREDRFPIIDILDQTPRIPDNCQWAIFLRNHDELTLEMVTDEERDYMYRVYARDMQSRLNLGIRRRLAPLLGNNRRRIELMNSLLFTLPGTPVIYYGDEIGMGDNVYLGDRNGVRTPMQWSADRNAGFSRANPQQLYLPVIIDPEYHFESLNVENQQGNPSSLLWWMKRLIDIRKRHRAFSRGQLQFLHPRNRKILAFLRTVEEETVLVVVNLSRFVQYVELELPMFRGVTPVELFGGTALPPIGQQSYFLTLGPHAFYWLLLTKQEDPSSRAPICPETGDLSDVWVSSDWTALFHPRVRTLNFALQAFLTRRWPQHPAEAVTRVWLTDSARLDSADGPRILAFVEIETSAAGHRYQMIPVGMATGQRADDLLKDHRELVITRVAGPAAGVLFDASQDSAFATAALDCFQRNCALPTSAGAEVVFRSLSAFAGVRGDPNEVLPVRPLTGEQANTSLGFGDRLVLKLYRYFEEGPHPEVEIGQLLTEKMGHVHSAPIAAVLEFRCTDRQTAAVGVLHGYSIHESDAWQLALDELSGFHDRVLSLTVPPPHDHPRLARIMDWEQTSPSPELQLAIGTVLEDAEILGRRTAELHAILASVRDPDFAPVRYKTHYQRSCYQALRTLQMDAFDRLLRESHLLPEAERPSAEALLSRQSELLGHFRALTTERLDAMRIRCHGDFNLSQLLHTGKDYVLIDFEGPSWLPLGVRRIKRSPLSDVANMICSFDSAMRASLAGLQSGRGRTLGPVRAEDIERLRPWFSCWAGWTCFRFVQGYFASCRETGFQPASEATLRLLLPMLLLERGLSELETELRCRPDRAPLPLHFLLDALDDLADRQSPSATFNL